MLPAWAPLLVTAHLQPIAKKVVWGTLAALEMAIFTPIIAQLKGEDFAGKPVIIKGCTHHFIPQSVYVALLQKLQPYAKRLMCAKPVLCTSCKNRVTFVIIPTYYWPPSGVRVQRWVYFAKHLKEGLDTDCHYGR